MIPHALVASLPAHSNGLDVQTVVLHAMLVDGVATRCVDGAFDVGSRFADGVVHDDESVVDVKLVNGPCAL